LTIIRVLFLGDIFGEPGRRAVQHFVPELRKSENIDLVLANGENAAHGRGISQRIAADLFAAGIDLMTGGNHSFDVFDSYAFLNDPNCKIIRPSNLSRHAPGRGTAVVETRNGVRVGVLNVMGRVFMEPGVNLPFDAVDESISNLTGDCDVMVLDFHAETTSEKRAMGWYLDGRVQLMVGTHTHVQTADEEILPAGTAYITDLGMCGPHDSVIGMRKDLVIRKMRTGLPFKFEIGEKDVRLNGLIADIDSDRKRAVGVKRVSMKLP